MTRRIIRITLTAIIGILLLLGGVFALYLYTPLQPLPEALTALESDDAVTVEQGTEIVFRPNGDTATTGIIFYPGARVIPLSYAPILRDIAEAGYLVVLTPMPVNTSSLAPQRALDVIDSDDYPNIEQWIITGHSNGARTAAQFVSMKPDAIAGLVMWAGDAVHDLSALDVSTLLIYGTEDWAGLLSSIEGTTRENLPANTQYIEIAGANHGGYGSYNPHYIYPDGEATISREEQQQQTLTITLEFYEEVFGE